MPFATPRVLLEVLVEELLDELRTLLAAERASAMPASH
jgi:hypothetical protein